MRRERNPLLTAYAVIVYVLLFAPIAILILFSFNDSRRTLRWHGFTTDWYGSLFENDELLDAVVGHAPGGGCRRRYSRRSWARLSGWGSLGTGPAPKARPRRCCSCRW